MLSGTKYVCTKHRNSYCRKNKKQLSGHILFAGIRKSSGAIRRYFQLTCMPICLKSTVPTSKSYKVRAKFPQSSHNSVSKKFSIVRSAVVNNRVILKRCQAKIVCLVLGSSDPNYRTKQMASGDARDPWVTGQQIGTQSLKRPKNT